LELLKDIKYVYYSNIGENLDFIVNNNLKNFKFIYRDIDLLAWPFCEKEFFNFKKNIPMI